MRPRAATLDRMDPPPDPRPVRLSGRRMILVVWALALAALAVAVARSPPDPARLASLAEAYRTPALALFGVVMALRGLLLLPTTPVLLAGAVVFAATPAIAVVVALAGVVASAALVYAFADRLGVAAVLDRRYPEALASMRAHLAGPGGFASTVVLAATPVLPTYLVCYAASLVHVPERPYLVAVALGEAPLVTLYLVGGAELVTHLLG